MRKFNRLLASLLSVSLLMNVPVVSANVAEVSAISSESVQETVLWGTADGVDKDSRGELAEMQTVTATAVNPMYADTISEETVAQWVAAAEENAREFVGRTTVSELDESALMPEAAVDSITEYMVARTGSFSIVVEFAEMPAEVAQYGLDLLAAAYADNPDGDGDEGDYLYYHYRGAALSASYSSGSGATKVTYTYEVNYLTTVQQEQAVTEKLQQVYAELNLDAVSGETKIGVIYDYITNHITYDHKHVDQGAGVYPVAWSAYGGLIDGTCVCQGYSSLTYRMMKESGIPVRVVTGYSGGPHAWNIVAIDGLYYNIDSTWDGYTVDESGNLASPGTRMWYLLSMDDFGNHLRDSEYLTDEFQFAYPMAANSYGKESSGEMLEIDNVSYSFSTVGGDTFSTTASSDECVVLVFGRVSCGFTQYYTELLRDSGIAANRRVRCALVDIDSAGTNVQSYEAELACEDISVCYGAESGGSTAMWKYCGLCGKGGSVTFPVVVVIDGNNKIRNFEVNPTSVAKTKDCLRQLLDYKAPSITSTKATAEGITVTWNAIDTAEKYHVYCNTKAGAEYVELAEVSDTTYTYKVPGPGTYSMAVSVEYGGIESDLSEAVSVECKQGAVGEVTLDQSIVKIFSYEEIALTAKVVAAMEGDTMDQTVTWESSDDTIATVAGGKVVGVKPGTVNITATSAKDTTKKATCAVTVKDDFTITYELNGGTLASSNPAAYNPYYPDLSLEAPTKVDASFVGWYRSADFVNDTYMKNIPAGSDYGNLTLYARWKEQATVAVPKANIYGEVEKGTKIKLSSDTMDALIYYTVDGTNPNRNSKLYTDAIFVDKAMEIHAFAVKDGLKDSEVAVFKYTVKDTSADLGDVWPEDVPAGGVIPEGLWVAGVEDVVYTGKGITFDLRVYHGKKLLTEKTDYTISYKNNKAAAGERDKKAPSVIVTGKGNYKDKAVETFTIEPLSIRENEFEVDRVVVAYNGKEQKPIPVLYRNGKKLKAKTEYQVSYPDLYDDAYVEPGTYKIVLKGCGNFCEELETRVTITKAALMSKTKIDKIPAQPYKNGEEVKPVIVVRNGKEVVDSSMYSVSYRNNYFVGTATVRIEGDGVNYVGVKTATFKITGAAMSKVKVENLAASLPYTGNEVTQDGVKLTYTDPVTGTTSELLEDVDYRVSYSKNINAGTATVTFKGMGKFTGTLKKTYKIRAFDINDNQGGLFIVNYKKSVPYSKGGSKPAPDVYFDGVTLKAGKDYTFSYKNNKALNDGSNASKAANIVLKGKGNFKGTITYTFKITKQDIRLLDVQAADKVVSQKANAYKSVPKVYDLDGKLLKAGTDYEKEIVYRYDEDVCLADGSFKLAGDVVGSKDILPAGTVIRVELVGKGNYEANVVSGRYRIVRENISKAKVKVNAQEYTGKAVEPGKDQIHITLKGAELSPADYEIVSYRNNVKQGTATMVIRGVRQYGGTKTVKFAIAPKAVKDIDFMFDWMNVEGMVPFEE